MPKAGEKLTSDELGVQVIVTKAGDAEIVIEKNEGDGLKVGKRYQSSDGVTEVMVTKPGPAALVCGGEAMVLQEPKKTKSAD